MFHFCKVQSSLFQLYISCHHDNKIDAFSKKVHTFSFLEKSKLDIK